MEPESKLPVPPEGLTPEELNGWWMARYTGVQGSHKAAQLALNNVQSELSAVNTRAGDLERQLLAARAEAEQKLAAQAAAAAEWQSKFGQVEAEKADLAKKLTPLEHHKALGVKIAKEFPQLSGMYLGGLILGTENLDEAGLQSHLASLAGHIQASAVAAATSTFSGASPATGSGGGGQPNTPGDLDAVVAELLKTDKSTERYKELIKKRQELLAKD